MSVVARQRETKQLEQIYKSRKAEFLAIYGRRRVGKTFLIREFFATKACLFFNVTGSKEGNYHDQITNFHQRMGDVFFQGIAPSIEKNWQKTFFLLNRLIDAQPKQKKIVLFFDELPWMVTPRSKLLQTLDYYWNQYWSENKNLKLVVCGSSASWIIKNIINNKGGLHNRITDTIHLQPFTLAQTEGYLHSRNIQLKRKQIVELYMAIGGIPYYLSKVQKGKSAIQIIEQLAFSPKAFLLDEFDNLFASLFEDYDAYVELIEVIASQTSGLSQTDLFKKAKKTSKGDLGLKRLKSLEETGFIMRFIPHFHKKRGVYYRVIDEYVLFYLYWIAPLKITKMNIALEKGYWKELTQTPTWYSWAGRAFESVCYKHIKQIRKALDLSPTAIPNTWRYSPEKNTQSGTQIDLLFDRNDDAITLCEIKYTQKPFVIDKTYAETLRHRQKLFQQVTRTKKQCFTAFISAQGLKENQHAEHLVSGVVRIDDLFK